MGPKRRKLSTPTSGSFAKLAEQSFPATIQSPERSGEPSGSGSSPKPLTGNAKHNRIHYACVECYRRKQKCNRQRPCQHCVSRNIPDKCRTYMPNGEAKDTDSRLARVEKLLEEYLPSILRHIDPSPSLLSTNTRGSRPTAARPSLRTYGAELGRENARLTTSSVSVDAKSASQEPEETEPHGRLSPETGLYNGGPTNHITSLLGGLPGGPHEIKPINLPVRTVGATSDIDDAMMQYGRPSPPSFELLDALISRNHCDALVNHYFKNIDWMHQPLPQTRVRKAFDAFWQSDPKVTVQNINIFATLCNLCAVAALSVLHVLFPGPLSERSSIARRYHYAGRRALLMSSFMGREDIDQIIAWVLSCHFLVLDRRYGEAYTASASVIRAAFSIGLHRDGTKLGLPDDEIELRRRVWAAVYCLDRSLAAGTGRPALIHDRFCDTRAVDDQASEDISVTPPQLAQRDEVTQAPTTYTLTFYRYQLARLEGQVATLFQSLEGTVGVENVLALDQKIRDFQGRLPPYYRAELTEDGLQCDKSLDGVHDFLLTHRYLINSDINSLRMALHRPYLLRSIDTKGDRFSACRKACLEAALHQAELLRDGVRNLRAAVPSPESRLVWRVQIGTHSWFQSLLVCGLGLLMEPHAPNAARLKSHLQYYLQEYHERGFIAMDDMSEREAKVISLFLSRLEQLEQGSMSPNCSTSEESGPDPGRPDPARASTTDAVCGTHRQTMDSTCLTPENHLHRNRCRSDYHPDHHDRDAAPNGHFDPWVATMVSGTHSRAPQNSGSTQRMDLISNVYASSPHLPHRPTHLSGFESGHAAAMAHATPDARLLQHTASEWNGIESASLLAKGPVQEARYSHESWSQAGMTPVPTLSYTDGYRKAQGDYRNLEREVQRYAPTLEFTSTASELDPATESRESRRYSERLASKTRARTMSRPNEALAGTEARSEPLTAPVTQAYAPAYHLEACHTSMAGPETNLAPQDFEMAANSGSRVTLGEGAAEFAPLGLGAGSTALQGFSAASASLVSATAGLHQSDFDPAYWQDLIDKILS